MSGPLRPVQPRCTCMQNVHGSSATPHAAVPAPVHLLHHDTIARRCPAVTGPSGSAESAIARSHRLHGLRGAPQRRADPLGRQLAQVVCRRRVLLVRLLLGRLRRVPGSCPPGARLPAVRRAVRVAGGGRAVVGGPVVGGGCLLLHLCMTAELYVGFYCVLASALHSVAPGDVAASPSTEAATNAAAAVPATGRAFSPQHGHGSRLQFLHSLQATHTQHVEAYLIVYHDDAAQHC